MLTPICPRCGLEIEKIDCSACGAIVPEVYNPERRLDTGSPSVADLETQLEDLLDAVYKAEADWRFNDRIDLAVKSA